MSPEAMTIGWDIGGAHVKVACLDHRGHLIDALELSTPLWRGLESLQNAVAEVAARMPLLQARHAITMTGELVDLFDDRTHGVRQLVAFMGERLPSGSLTVYAGRQGFVRPEQVERYIDDIASANWHATADMVAARVQDGLLVDIGSTTADILPFAAGRVLNRGYSDRERMACSELVYTGVVRTPLMSLCRRVPFQGQWTDLAAEHFATTADVYRLTGDLPEHADLGDTADGRGKSLKESTVRLARMIGADAADADRQEWLALAAYLAEQQLQNLQNACALNLSRAYADAPTLVGAGVGSFVARRLAERLQLAYVDFDQWFAAADGGARIDAATCAPAVAVATLAPPEVESCAC